MQACPPSVLLRQTQNGLSGFGILAWPFWCCRRFAPWRHFGSFPWKYVFPRCQEGSSSVTRTSVGLLGLLDVREFGRDRCFDDLALEAHEADGLSFGFFVPDELLGRRFPCGHVSSDVGLSDTFR